MRMGARVLRTPPGRSYELSSFARAAGSRVSAAAPRKHNCDLEKLTNIVADLDARAVAAPAETKDAIVDAVETTERDSWYDGCREN